MTSCRHGALLLGLALAASASASAASSDPDGTPAGLPEDRDGPKLLGRRRAASNVFDHAAWNAGASAQTWGVATYVTQYVTNEVAPRNQAQAQAQAWGPWTGPVPPPTPWTPLPWVTNPVPAGAPAPAVPGVPGWNPQVPAPAPAPAPQVRGHWAADGTWVGYPIFAPAPAPAPAPPPPAPTQPTWGPWIGPPGGSPGGWGAAPRWRWGGGGLGWWGGMLAGAVAVV